MTYIRISKGIFVIIPRAWLVLAKKLLLLLMNITNIYSKYRNVGSHTRVKILCGKLGEVVLRLCSEPIFIPNI